MKIVNLKTTTKEYFKNQKIIKPESKNCYKKRLMLTNAIANAGLRVG
jgi:hypothetical protein